ncbi:MAG: FliM/FliN family flagellar motor switch protein [Acidobacteria bacterium]|nr:FliM/FliN family flagellar motor switch protein [Acidobacteriota bacterium]
MQKNLGQDDIDALFAAANASVKVAQESRNECEPETYVFSRAGKISNDQMRAISTVNDLFARNLMHAMSGWLRAPFRAKLVAGEQLPFSEFIERLSTLAYLCSVRLEPLGAVGLIEIDLSLAAPIVDVLLGGTGTAGPLRELTEIEESIMTSVVEVIVQELSLAWQPVGLEFALEKRETEAQAARTMTLGEKTLCVSFDLKMIGAQGVLNLCLPAVVLNAILRRLITEGDRPRRRSEDASKRMRELMSGAVAGVTLQLPPMRLPASQIAGLEPGSVIRLPVSRHECSELRIGGIKFASAWPVRSCDHRAARLHGMQESIANEPTPATVPQLN